MAWKLVYNDTREGMQVDRHYEVNKSFQEVNTKKDHIENIIQKWVESRNFGGVSWALDTLRGDTTGESGGIIFSMKPSGTKTILRVSLRGPTYAKSANVEELAEQIKDAILNVTEAPELEKRDIRRGSEDAVTMEEIKNGDSMVDFHDEFKTGRYYKQTTFEKLGNKNPYTRKAISSRVKYTANIVEGGKRRRSTRKHRKTRRSTKR